MVARGSSQPTPRSVGPGSAAACAPRPSGQAPPGYVPPAGLYSTPGAAARPGGCCRRGPESPRDRSLLRHRGRIGAAEAINLKTGIEPRDGCLGRPRRAMQLQIAATQLQIAEDKRRHRGFYRAEQLHDWLVLTADRETEANPTIAAAVFICQPLGAADRDTRGPRQLFDAALEVCRGDRVASAIQSNFSGARGRLRLGQARPQRG